MENVTLGRTGLSASVMGLGGGGDSRLGHQDEASAIRLVHEALARGVNLIDTAEAYGTEEVIGKALRGTARERVILSTKKTTFDVPELTPEHVVRALEDSLRRLGTDYVDIYHLHGVRPDAYPALRDRLVPTLRKLQEQGKLRFLGITEAFAADPGHLTLQAALTDDLWDVIMVGFNILNQSARATVFPRAIAQRVGTLIMFAVRRALSRPQRLQELLDQLAAQGKIAPATARDGLDFLVREGGASSLPDAAYRFCRDEPGAHVVLSGTGNAAHLRENVASLERAPLAVHDRARLVESFREVADVSGH